MGGPRSKGDVEELPCDDELEGHGSLSLYNACCLSTAVSIRVRWRRCRSANICAVIVKIDLWKAWRKGGATKREEFY